MTIYGSCLCKAVTYEIDGPLMFAGNCHCSICRKSHGAAFATWGMIKPEQLRWTSGTDALAAYESSPGRKRLFCAGCGSPLAFEDAGQIREIVLGSIDGDPGVRPIEHIFVGSKAPWYEITDALPRHDRWPPGMG